MQLVLNTYGSSLQRENEGLVVITSDGERQIRIKTLQALTQCLKLKFSYTIFHSNKD